MSHVDEQKIICSQTLLDDIAHEQTIICRQSLGGISANEWEEKFTLNDKQGCFAQFERLLSCIKTRPFNLIQSMSVLDIFFLWRTLLNERESNWTKQK